jgi:nitrite reductase (cytochrome c-552)
MNPDAILKYYNELIVDGQPFADYVNPRSGVRQIKVQHPEFETYSGAGNVHAGTYSCADCHMGIAVNSEKKAYINHEWTSPLNNESLVKNTCSACHSDLAADVRKRQEAGKGRCVELGKSLAGVMEELVAAVNSRRYSEEKLNAVRKVFRDSQFYWDFVFVENSEGAHNSRLTKYCLDKSEALMKEAKDLIAKL